MQKKLGIFSLIFLLSFAQNNCGQTENRESSFNWKTLKAVAEAYYNNPSTENAHKFYLALPRQFIPVTKYREDGFEPIVDFILEESNLIKLEKQIYASNRNAVKVAFLLFNLADGTSGEILELILGDLIPINPKLYLEELKAHKNTYFVKNIGPPLQNFGWIDSNEELENRIILRIKALESVKDKELIEIRDESSIYFRDMALFLAFNQEISI